MKDEVTKSLTKIHTIKMDQSELETILTSHFGLVYHETEFNWGIPHEGDVEMRETITTMEEKE